MERDDSVEVGGGDCSGELLLVVVGSGCGSVRRLRRLNVETGVVSLELAEEDLCVLFSGSWGDEIVVLLVGFVSIGRSSNKGFEGDSGC